MRIPQFGLVIVDVDVHGAADAGGLRFTGVLGGARRNAEVVDQLTSNRLCSTL